MSKHYLTICLIVCLCLAGGSFAAPSIADNANCDLSINDVPVKLSSSARLVDGIAMLPMREFFEKMGAGVSWYPDDRIVTAYRNNMQIKLAIDQTTAYRNGQPFNLPCAPLIIDDQTYLPAQFIAESFDMFYQFKDATINLVKRNIDKTYFINFMEYNTHYIAEYDLTMVLPFGWYELADNRFGIDDEYDDYALSVNRYERADFGDSAAFIASQRQKLIDHYGDIISFTYQKTIYGDDLNYESFGYFLNGETDKRIIDNYVLEQGEHYYFFACDSAATTDINYIRSMIQIILNKVQFNAATIETSDEHYFEYPELFAAKMTFNALLSSNMDVYNYLPFSGKIADGNRYDKLYAVVSKGFNQIDFKIGIAADGNFNAKIFTPFGLAKHNIAIYGHKRGQRDDLLLQFSVLNLSNEPIQHLIPSEYVQSNKTEALSLASYLTYKKSGQYFKAKSIFDYIVSDINLESDTLDTLERLRNSTAVITDQSATPLEMTLAMTALLRASDIPAKVIYGKLDGRIHYAVEAKINGLWAIYDPVSFLLWSGDGNGQSTGFAAPPDLQLLKPFHYINRHIYLSLLKDYRVLKY